jgi:hypothetical protein
MVYRTTVIAVIVLSLLFLFGCGTELDVVAPASVEVKSVKVTADEIRLNFTPNRSGNLKFTIPYKSVSDFVSRSGDFVINIPVTAGEEYTINTKHNLPKEVTDWGKCIVTW